VPVPVVERLRPTSPSRASPAPGGPYLGGVNALETVVVLHPVEVQTSQLIELASGGDLMGELGRGETGEDVKNVLPDPAEFRR